MRWEGNCYECHRWRPLETRYEHAAKTLCDECARKPPVKPSGSSIYASDTLTAPPRQRPESPAVGGNDTRTRTRTRETSSKENQQREPEAVGSPEETAEVDELLIDYRARKIAPAQVVLRPLPAGSSEALVKVRDDFALIAGLRRAVDDPRPVPYGCAWVADRIGLSKKHVARTLQQLVALGVLEHVGNMPGRGRGREGTRLYNPGRAF